VGIKVVCLPWVVRSLAFTTNVTVRCVRFHYWCKPPVVGAVKGPLACHPGRVAVAFTFDGFRAYVAIVVQR